MGAGPLPHQQQQRASTGVSARTTEDLGRLWLCLSPCLPVMSQTNKALQTSRLSETHGAQQNMPLRTFPQSFIIPQTREDLRRLRNSQWLAKNCLLREPEMLALKLGLKRQKQKCLHMLKHPLETRKTENLAEKNRKLQQGNTDLPRHMMGDIR